MPIGSIGSKNLSIKCVQYKRAKQKRNKKKKHGETTEYHERDMKTSRGNHTKTVSCVSNKIWENITIYIYNIMEHITIYFNISMGKHDNTMVHGAIKRNTKRK